MVETGIRAAGNATLDATREDLRYVRNAVERRVRGPMPLSIALLWAAIVLVGFSLPDFAPQATGTFWMIAGPVGFLLSAYFGYRESLAAGEADRAEGLRHMLHWGGMLAAVFLAALSLDAAQLGRVIVLVLALSYFLAGLHITRGLIWVGAVLALGYVGLGYLDAYAWTALGALVALALAASGLAGRSRG